MSGSWNMLVFRDGRHAASGPELVEQAAAEVQELAAAESPRLLHALLRCGELECALSDVSPAETVAAAATDALAEALVNGATPPVAHLQSLLNRLEPPPRLTVTAPEGFAFYALHPLDFVDLIAGLELPGNYACVVGIRSIGTTLSAVVAAALRARGLETERFTVRPAGHPFERNTGFLDRELRKVQGGIARDAVFIVVDEGPGLSGSSFISVGEALLGAGVPRRNIVFLCSRATDGSDLTTRNGAERWRSYQSYCVPAPQRFPADCGLVLSGGQWRPLAFESSEQWPAVWTQSERIKLLSRDRRRLYKFEGLGHYGDVVFERAALLARAGFSPHVDAIGDGFASYEWLLHGSARPGVAEDLDRGLIHRIADYCAFRATRLAVERSSSAALEAMARHNYKQEFGEAAEVHLPVVRPVITDNRMAPHEWIVTADGHWMKTDAAADGDDHFYPGPTDVAWDLAGAIVEWAMPDKAAADLLHNYAALSGDDVNGRIEDYIFAYAAFRLGWARMAALNAPEDEQRRWKAAAQHYRAVLQRPRALPIAA